MEIKEHPTGQVSPVSQDEKGNIFQLGMTNDQYAALQVFVAQLTKEKPFTKMCEEHNLVLKSKVKKMKK